MTLEDLFRGRNFDINGMMVRLRQVAEQENLPFGNRTHTYNSRLAQELGKWAENHGLGEPYHDAAFKAYFVHGKNIAQSAVLEEIAESIGLEPGDAREAIESRVFESSVDEDWSLARSLGITAVPTFNLNGRSLVGAQPYPAMEQFLRQNGIENI